MKRILERPWLVAFLILLISWLTVRVGIAIGEATVPPGSGYLQKYGINENLFRFDAEYYYAIATEGYSFNGDPHSSPNIVFAPFYPFLISLLASLPGVSAVSAGFLLNKIFLFLALFFLYQYFSTWLNSERAFWILTAMATSAGAYSFHAYYSESTMLLALSLILWGQQRRNWPLMAVAATAAGASRIAALPMTLVTASYFLVQMRRQNISRKVCLAALAGVCGVGSAAYLSYLAWQFGNPFRLLPEIQGASWGFFHPETSWLAVVTGANLFSFAQAAAERGFVTLIHIKTLNLIWTLLALTSVVYSFRKFGPTFFTLLFTAYFLFVYLTGAGSDFLISAHRFYVLMLPIFVMFAGLSRNRTVAEIFVSVNVFYGFLHTAFFNQGIWFYF